MKPIYITITLILSLIITCEVHAQEKTRHFYDSARVYYERHDFEKALFFYEAFYADTANWKSNYDAYYAAVAACHTGNVERVKYYLAESARVGYDLGSYGYFANDSLNRCFRGILEWDKFIGDFKQQADSFQKELDAITAVLNDTIQRANSPLFSNNAYWEEVKRSLSPQELVSKVKSYSHFQEIKGSGFWTLYHITIDTAQIPFLLYVPDNYVPTKETPLYVYLHGAVVNRREFADPAYVPGGLEIQVMEPAKEQGAFILYPFGKRDFGWIYQQEAFEAVLEEIAYVKSLYNIDDNKVYIGGHSNGGSGAFWFSTKKPSVFSAIFGLNYLPLNYTSNTTLRNFRNNVPFFGVSGLEDKTFAISLVDDIYQYSKANGANWENYSFAGSHGFALRNVDSIRFLFDTLIVKERNPFATTLEWETDDVRNGRIHWMEITALDTLAERADWHTDLLPGSVLENRVKLPFNTNRTGAIIADVADNTIDIKSSRVKSLSFYLSPEMFDFDQEITVIVDGQTLFKKKVEIDKHVVLDEFLKTKDRKFIVGNILKLDIN